MYTQGMKLLNELEGCEPAGNLIDYILTNKAFNLSLLVGDYSKAITYWEKFFDGKERSVNNKCGCYGRTR